MPYLTRIVPSTALLVLALAACAPTQQQAAAPAAAAPASAAAPAATVAAAQTESDASTTVASSDEVVCKKYDVTGSRVAKRKVCMTRGEWAEYTRRTQDEYQRASDRRGSFQPGGESLGTR